MTWQQMLMLNGALGNALAHAAGHHPAGALAAGEVDVIMYLTKDQKALGRLLGAGCQEAAPVAPEAPAPYAEPLPDEGMVR